MMVIFKKFKDVNENEMPTIISEMKPLFDGTTVRELRDMTEIERNMFSYFHGKINWYAYDNVDYGSFGYINQTYFINPKWFTKISEFDTILHMFEEPF